MKMGFGGTIPGMAVFALVCAVACLADGGEHLSVFSPPLNTGAAEQAYGIKEAVPDREEASYQKAMSLFSETYRERIAAAKTAAEKLDLVGEWTESARKSTGAEKYVLLEQARDLAADLGDVRAVMRAVDLILSSFDDDIRLKAEAIERVSKNLRSVEQANELSSQVRDFAVQASAAERYELTERVLTAALAASRAKVGNREWEKEILDLQKHLKKVMGEARQAEGGRVPLPETESMEGRPRALQEVRGSSPQEMRGSRNDPGRAGGPRRSDCPC